MPELPDIVVYIERLEHLLGGRTLRGVRVGNPFVVRTYQPALEALVGQRVDSFRRMGKRIVFRFSQDLYLVVHLMIAGRLRFKKKDALLPRRLGHLALDFDHGTLLLTEASTKKRASVHVLAGAEGLCQFERGGLEPLESTLTQFQERLRSENRTLKRALTDPQLVSGIGNAYSDEILHAARLSPVKRTLSLTDAELKRLHTATRRVLELWTARLRDLAGDSFPDKVTAFHEQMSAHGRFRLPCPVCGTPIQRIRYASNEVNYCPECQTNGQLLADRGLSRLLKADWPRSLDELDELRSAASRAEPDE